MIMIVMVIKIAIKMVVMMMMVLTAPLTSNQLSLHPGHQHTLILLQLGLNIFLVFKSAIVGNLSISFLHLAIFDILLV